MKGGYFGEMMEVAIVTHISRDQATLRTKYNGRSQRRLASDQNSMGVEITVEIDVKVGRERGQMLGVLSCPPMNM